LADARVRLLMAESSPKLRRINVGFINLTVLCAVKRRCLPAGANPARHLSLRPVAIGAIVEVTKRLKPSV
jgi:hypothetical protein